MAPDARFGILIETTYKNATAAQQALRDAQALEKAIKQSGVSSQAAAQAAAQLGRSMGEAAKTGAQFAAQTAKFAGANDALKASFGDLLSALKAMPGPAGDAASKLQTLTNSIGGLAGKIPAVTIGIAAAAAAVVGFGAAAITASHHIGDYQEKMDLAAESTGLTVEQVGGLKVAASNVGRSFEQIEPGIAIFTRNLGDARTGSETATAAFQRLGTDGAGALDPLKSTGDVLKEVGARLMAIPDPTTRASIAADLFGRSWAQILPIISQNLTAAEQLAIKLGVTLTPAMQQVAKDADVAGDKLKLQFLGAWNKLTVALAPLGTKIVETMSAVLSSVEGLNATIDDTNTAKAVEELDKYRESARRAGEEAEKAKRKMIPLPSTEGGQLGVGALISNTILTPPGITRQKTAEGGLSIPYGATLGAVQASGAAMYGPFLDKAAKERLDAENQFNDQVKALAKARADAEAEDREALRKSFETTAEAHNKAGLTITGVPVKGLPTKDELADKAYQDAVQENQQFWGEVSKSIAAAKRGAGQPAEEKPETKSAVDKNAAAVRGFQTALDVLHTSLISASAAAAFTARDFRNLTTEMVKAVLALAAPALGPFAGVFGSILSFFDQGGVVRPVGAQAGLVVRGIRGRDSVHAMIGKDERVLSVRRNDMFETLLERLSTQPLGAAAGGGNTFSPTIHVHVDPRDDARATQLWVRRQVIPALRDEMGSGRFWVGS